MQSFTLISHAIKKLCMLCTVRLKLATLLTFIHSFHSVKLFIHLFVNFSLRSIADGNSAGNLELTNYIASISTLKYVY